MECNEQIKLKTIHFASWGHYRAVNIAKQQLLFKSTQEANSCHSLLIREELVVSGLEDQSKPGHGRRPRGEGIRSLFAEGLRGAGRASGSSPGRHSLGMGSSGGPRLPELQVNVTVLHPHGQTQHRWESLPQEQEWFI